MADSPQDEESDGSSRAELIENRLLHTAYEQAGAEYRHRDRLLHGSSYLLIVVTALLAGPFLRYAGQDARRKLSAVVILAGGLYTLLGLAMLIHYVQRNAASSLRERVEQVADGSKERIRRPFAVQSRVVGRDARLMDEGDPADARPLFSSVLRVPEDLRSAETLAQAVLVVGFTLIVVGVGLLTSGWALVYNLLSMLAALVALGAFVLLLRSIDPDLASR